jgi:hypothetical protein
MYMLEVKEETGVLVVPQMAQAVAAEHQMLEQRKEIHKQN